jgi:hypothetical protein
VARFLPVAEIEKMGPASTENRAEFSVMNLPVPEGPARLA